MDKVLASIKHHLKMECVNEGGPSLDTTMAFTVDVREDPVMRRVLEVKGELVVVIKALAIASVNQDFADMQRQLREQYAVDVPQVGSNEVAVGMHE